MTHYKCIRIEHGYTGRMFHVDGIYQSVDTENTPAVIDDLGHVRVIASSLRFIVGYRPSNLTPWIELPIFAHFAPVEAGDAHE
jgi:hypothetical protein